MKALVLRQDSFKVEDIDRPSIQKGQALVRIRYAALNHRDQWIRIGQYAKIQLPAILGSDGCGIVEEVAAKEDRHWIGKEVVINPNIHWGPDHRFQSKDYQILGMPAQGTLAEHVAVNTDRLHAKPAYLAMQDAAALPLAGLTAYNAVFNKGKVQAGMNVLISGVGGGVAQFAFLFAKAVGAHTYVTSSKRDVIEHCKRLGAKDGLKYTEKDAIKKFSKSIGGFDVIIDSACGDGMNELIASLKPGGRFVFYGATRGLPHELNMRQVFWNHLQLLGSTMGSDEDFFRMLDFCSEHSIQPIVDKVFTLDHAVDAFDRMQMSEQFGKILVKI
jgi:NADPH:quinone reductase-like Zn-dependent oxidoreductase